MNRLLPPLASLCTICLISACQSAPPASSIELPALFSDNMVLQQEAVNTVWGTATPGGRVVVLFNDQVSEVVADTAGRWRVYLNPLSHGGPYEMYVAGQDTLTIRNVLVGEVWLASGQSNMQWPLRETDRAEADIPAADYPEIRLFTVNRTTASTPQTSIPGDGWHMTTPDQVPNFSAVAYYFGRTLYDSLEVPIGLIHSSWGGTPAEAWTSATTLLELPDFKDEVEAIQAQAARKSDGPQTFEERVQAWLQAIETNDRGYQNGEPAWAAADFDDADWSTIQAPQLWEEEALPDYDGIVWYRKTFDAPASWSGQDLTLNLAQIDDIDITWVNGIEVGRTQQYNQQRTYTIPASVVRTGPNVIAVRVLDTGGGGGIWGDAAAMSVGPATKPATLSLAGTWRYQPALDLKDASSLPPRPSAEQNTPTMLYNAMIHSLIPYRIKGVIWYQGESNAGRAHQYRTLFPAMIQDWRTRWEDDLAFYFVQLANFMELQDEPVEQETWPELREAQSMALDLPNTGMAVTIDIGEADDIHPRNKRDVGDRLARAALNTTYQKSGVTPSGPLYRDMTIEQGEIRISFDYADQGLQTPGDEPLQGFAIAGEDRVFHWGDAVIEESEVVVSNPDVPDPVAVRYGWANNPQVNLYNAEGLPASPFRTDDWPGVTEGIH